ncbi:MAG TPA: hypothetical protein VK365_09665 [Nocardioidaceae bacterium]|jgi:uncharacterized membrane protein YciS (DUF1049 family)|nr:hypothetical protein [Nocardioidaceae bacterium]
MTVLGIVILLAVAVVTATVVANGSEPATLNLVGFDVETTIAGIFAVGALCLLLAVLGIFLTLGGAKRGRRRRKEVRDLRRRADAPTGTDAAGTSSGTGGDPVHDERTTRRHGASEDDPDDPHFRSVPRE